MQGSRRIKDYKGFTILKCSDINGVYYSATRSRNRMVIIDHSLVVLKKKIDRIEK